MCAQLDGVQWELIGIVWREVEVEGTKYPWQEFLLYNLYYGYRYLLYFLYDGHFALGSPLAQAPGASPRALRQAERAIAETAEHHAHVRLRPLRAA